MIPIPEKIEFRFVISKNDPRIWFHRYKAFNGFEIKLAWFYFQVTF